MPQRSVMEWKDDIVFTFVKKIQLRPCLWNPKDQNKKNRNKVHDAFKSIAEEMKIDDIGELKKKKENLFQTYRNYRRKVLCSEKSGAGLDDIYRPTWPPYSLLDGFLHGIYTPKGTFDTLDNLDNGENKKNSEEEGADNDNETSSTDFNENAETVQHSDINKKKDVPTRQPVKQSGGKRSRMKEDRADVAFRELIAIKNQIAAKSASSVVIRDECTVYGELLAIKLRKLDERTQRLAMNRIDTIMFDLSFHSADLPTPRSSHSSYVLLPSPSSSCSYEAPQLQLSQSLPSTSQVIFQSQHLQSIHPTSEQSLPSPSSSCSQYSPQPAQPLQTSNFYEQPPSNSTTLLPCSAVSNETLEFQLSQ